MTGRNLIVRALDGTEYRIKGAASWTEPPMFPAEEPRPVLKNTEIEISQDEARQIKEHFAAALREPNPVVVGRGWAVQQTDSMYIQVFDAQLKKIASFNPLAVETLYFEDSGDVVS